MGDQVMVDAGKFSNNEKVYVPHTDKYYEAKILKTEYRGQAGGWFYFLHYNGWNKKYDEWVEEGGLVKAEVAEAAGAGLPIPAKAKKTGGPMGAAAGGAGGFPASGGRGAAPGAGAAFAPSRAPRSGGAGATLPPLGSVTAVQGTGGMGLDIDLPAILKKYLVEDFESVFEESRFVPLPRTPCVADMFDKYVQEAKELRTGTVDAEEEVASGLQSYFDKTLLALLLYRNERGQAAHALADGRCPSAVYGAEHLLRLLFKLPEILPLAALTDDQLGTIATMVQDVVSWLADNHTSLFLTKEQYLPPNLQQAQKSPA